jgi:hypothetical protein
MEKGGGGKGGGKIGSRGRGGSKQKGGRGKQQDTRPKQVKKIKSEFGVAVVVSTPEPSSEVLLGKQPEDEDDGDGDQDNDASAIDDDDEQAADEEDPAATSAMLLAGASSSSNSKIRAAAATSASGLAGTLAAVELQVASAAEAADVEVEEVARRFAAATAPNLDDGNDANATDAMTYLTQLW